MAIKAVIFDLDGTIAAFNLDYVNVRAEVRSMLIAEGLPASLFSTNESMFEMLKKAEIYLKNQNKPRNTAEEIRNKALAIAQKHELEAAKTTSLFPGAVEMLKAIKSMKIKTGLCTINGGKSVDYILNRFKIASYFDATAPRDKVRYVKPNPEHLEKVLQLLQVEANESILVGDGVGDMKCAHELGAIAIGLPTGLSSAQDLIKAGADYIITSLTELPQLIKTIRETLTRKRRIK